MLDQFFPVKVHLNKSKKGRREVKIERERKLTFKIWFLRKLSSSSAVAEKSCLAIASILLKLVYLKLSLLLLLLLLYCYCGVGTCMLRLITRNNVEHKLKSRMRNFLVFRFIISFVFNLLYRMFSVL